MEMSYEPFATNDKSQLTEGFHPAYLLDISDEATPSNWEMFAKSPRMWRWHFAVWETPAHIGVDTPEHQSAVSSQKFSPGGKTQPAKAYVWACKLIGHQIHPGERVNLSLLMPIACRLHIGRSDKFGQAKEYADVKDLLSWPEGASMLTPDIQAQLMVWWRQKQAEGNQQQSPPPATAVHQSPPLPASQTPPAMASWGNPATETVTPAPVTGKTWS